MSLAIVLPDDKQIRLAIRPLDRAGQPARVDGVPSWTSSDESVLTVHPEADGMAALCVTVGPVGTAAVKVTADADLGTGVENLEETADFTVVGGRAASLGLSAGQPEDRP